MTYKVSSGTLNPTIPYRSVLNVFGRCVAASMRLCMGSRRGFIIRMKIGNVTPGAMDSASAASHCMRVRKRSTLGPSTDGQQYAVVHVTGYIKNWPPAGLYHVGMLLLLLLLQNFYSAQTQACSSQRCWCRWVGKWTSR